MKTRPFAKTGFDTSEIGLGCWQLGSADWGDVDEAQANDTLAAALDSGVNFLDTADVYGAGTSERRLGRFLARHPNRDRVRVATKFGRLGDPGGPANLSYEVMTRHTEGSLERLGMERLWLTQGHCLPTAALTEGRVFDHLRALQRNGLIEHFGMSVETVDEALLCLDVEGLSSLQVIFNVLRQMPAQTLFQRARERGVALIVRLPLASGLLSGKLTRGQTFASNDHRHYNRDGQAFNVGETFGGLPFEQGVRLAQDVRAWIPEGWTMAEFALRYCLDFPAVTTVIPGAHTPEQARANARASTLPSLSQPCHLELARFYTEQVHEHIRGVY